MAGGLPRCVILCTSLAPYVICSGPTSDMAHRLVPVHRRHGFLPDWTKTASDVAHFLGKPLQETTDFFEQLATRTNVVDILDLMYRLHPRLRFYLIFQLLIFCALLGAGLPITCVACKTRGTIPFLVNLVRSNQCVVCCVFIGVLTALVLANLVIMIGCHSGMTDAMRQLPAVYQIALEDLKLYINQTIAELFAELEEGEKGISEGIQRFLYNVLPHEALQRIRAIICKGNTSIFAFKLNDCERLQKSQVGSGISVQNISDLVWEHLQHQLKLALKSVDRMETSVEGFEAQTGLWATTRVLGLVAIPMIMVLICLIVAFMGFGIGLGLRNRVSQYTEAWTSYRYTGILMLTNAALVLMLFVFGSPLLMTMVTVGVLGEDYVCKPYRAEAYEHLHKLIDAVWPHSKRGEIFALLTPEHILAKCAGDGVSIAYLETATVLGMGTDMYSDKWTISRSFYTTPQVALRKATAGNCRPLHDVVRSSMNLFCNLYMDNHLGITLSLGTVMFLLLLVLPIVLVISQYFLHEESSEDDDYQDSSSLFRPENSEDDLVSNRNIPKYLENFKPKWDSTFSSHPSFLSDPWKSQLDEIYRMEGIDICNEVLGKRSNLGSKWHSGSLSKLRLKKIFRRTQERPLVSGASLSTLRIDPRVPPKRFINSVLVDEVFPRLPAIPHGKKNKFRSNIRQKLKCRTALVTIDEEPESLQSSYVSALSNVSEPQSCTSETAIVQRPCPVYGYFPHLRSSQSTPEHYNGRHYVFDGPSAGLVCPSLLTVGGHNSYEGYRVL